MLPRTPTSVLGEFENLWEPRLARVSLIAELDVTKQELNKALFCTGQRWRALGQIRAMRNFPNVHPAAFAVATAGTASLRFEGRNAWQPLLEGAGLHYDMNTASSWGRTFVRCLEELGLPTFPELDDEGALKYVARMLLHGGVPIDHLDEWFNVSVGAVRQLGTTDAGELQAWMVRRAEQKRLYGATVAVERFLRFGGEFAADFLDRSLELLERVRAGDGLDDIRVGLPRRYVERALELRELGLLPGGPGTRRQVTLRPTARPELRFDPYGVGIHLVLPPVEEDGPTVWHLSLDGIVEIARVTPPRPGEPAEPVTVVLPVGATEAQLSRSGAESHTMTVVDPNDPLMVFDPDGHLLDPTSRLPRDTVWAVHPATRTLSIPDAREVEVHEVVPRWPRWRAALLDVTAATELRLERGRRRIVETTRSATLRGLERVHAAASEDGAELLSQWPTLVLPGSAGGSEWHVTVHVIGGDGRVERQVEVGQHDVALSVGAMAADFAAKSVRVRARGPLGRSLRRDIRVLPDLSIACQPAIRTFVDDGLSPTRVELSGVEDPGFVLNAQELSRRVHLDTKPAIVVEPPSLAVQHVRNAVPTAWRHAPLVIELEELVDEPGHLLVRLPTELQALELRLQDGRGATCQRITHTGPRRRDGAVLFDLARFTDTLRDLGSGTLALGSDVWSGRIASVRPAKLAQLVEPTADGELRIVGVHAQGVSAGVYARLVPTRGPVVFEVPPGDVTLPLPSELADLGQLRVLLRLNDPWAPEPWPTFPAAGRNVHDVERAPDLDALAVAHPLALYLTAAAPLPDLGGYLGDALHIFTLAYQLEAPRAGDNIRAELADQLRARPADVLGAVLSSDLQARELAPTLCMTGLVATLLDPPLPIEDVERLWTRWPGAAVLAVGDHITEDEAGLQFLVERSGPTVQELLDGQTVAALSMPRLDMPALVEWDAPRLHGLRAEAAIVPRVLLDPDSRADDGFQLILALKDANRGERLARVNREAEQLVRYALNRILDPAGAAALAAGVRGRIQGEGWQLLPAASLALCGAARIAARTRNPFGVFNLWSQKALARLAEALPRLVAADLLMAELSLQGGSK